MNHMIAFANIVLGVFGRRIIRSYIGHWYIDSSGRSTRRKIFIGHRLARREEYEGLAESATELDRFVQSHKDEINARQHCRGR